MRVLIIEDEYNLADVISESLKKEKYLLKWMKSFNRVL